MSNPSHELPLEQMPDVPEKVDRLNRLAGEAKATDPVRALSLTGQAIELAEKLVYGPGLAEAILLRVTCLITTNQPFTREPLEQAIQIFVGENNRSGQAHAVMLRGQYFVQNKDYTAGLSDYESSLSIFRRLGDAQSVAVVLAHMGHVYRYQNDLAMALSCYEESLAATHTSGDEFTEATVHSYMADIYGTIGDYAAAMNHYLTGHELFEKLGHSAGCAITLLDLGKVYNHQQQLEMALDNFQRSLEIFREIGHEHGVACALGNIGRVYEEKGDFSAALNHFQQVYTRSVQQKDTIGEAKSLLNIGHVYFKLINYENAEHYYQLALDLCQKTNLLDIKTQVLTYLSEVYLVTARTADAVPILQQTLAMNQKIQAKETDIEIYRLLSQAYRHLGQFEAALTHFQKYHQFQKEVFNEASDEKLRNLQIIFQVDAMRKEAEIHRLENERMSRELNVAREIQAGLLPRRNPSIPGLLVDGFCQPAREVGGDYFDFIASPDGHKSFLVIADVTGKGVPACLLTVELRTLLYSLIGAGLPLREVVTQTNRQIYQDMQKTRQTLNISMLLFCWDAEKQSMSYISAGHDPFVHYDAGGIKAHLHYGGGMWLGMESNIMPYLRLNHIKLAPGDLIMMYTDGVSEYHNQRQEMYSVDRLVDYVSRSYRKDVAAIIPDLLQELEDFGEGALQHDDLALLVIKRDEKNGVHP